MDVGELEMDECACAGLIIIYNMTLFGFPIFFFYNIMLYL